MALLDSILALGAAFCLYLIGLAIYRLYFHPLAKFPGPKLAAMTEYWELYHDFIRNEGGFLFFELDTLHENYGPVVRVRPNEVHVKDSDWMRVLFTGPSEPRDRDPFVLAALGVPDATISTGPWELHRIRRNAIASFFSPTTFLEIEPKIRENALQVLDNLKQISGQVIDLRPYLYAWTTDFISELIFGRSFGLFGHHERAWAWFQVAWDFSRVSPVVKHAPFIVTSAMYLPLIAWKMFLPRLVPYISMCQDILSMAETSYNSYNQSSEQQFEEMRDNPKNIFDRILTSDLPKSEKLPLRLTNEAYNLLIAGGLSTAKTAQIALFHILADQAVHHALRKELRESIPNRQDLPDSKALQRLPYLGGADRGTPSQAAVIKETMRIASIVTMRVPMIARNKDLKHASLVMPAGMSISMTFCKAAKDPAIFPDPHNFRPERWLDGTQKSADYDRYVLPFGKGTRVCLGKQIAYAQLYMMLAGIFRRVDLRLFETTRSRDVDIVGGGPLGEPPRSSKGIRVQVNGMTQ